MASAIWLAEDRGSGCVDAGGRDVLAVPQFRHAGQSNTSEAFPLLRFIATAPRTRDHPRPTRRAPERPAGAGRADNDLGLMLVERGLSRGECGSEIIVVEGRVDDFKAVLGEVGRFDAARHRVPAVEEKDFHEIRTVLEGDAAGIYLPHECGHGGAS